MRVDRIEIDSTVTVIILSGAVLHDGSQPECRDAEVLQIVEMVANATQIAAVPGTRFRAVVRAREFGRLIVRWIAVGKAVGHDEVEDIFLRKTVKASCRRKPG